MQVQSLIKVLNADIGFVFNSDMSRASVVTDSGETLSEEYSFPIVADHVLQRAGKGAGVVSNCCTTRTLDDIVRMRGGVLHKGKVGQAHTIDKMFETGSVLAGAVLLLLGDLFARVAMMPIILPIGAITSFLGGPLFLYLLFKGGTRK